MTRLHTDSASFTAQPVVYAPLADARARPTHEELSAILQIAHALFPGDVSVATEWDPEFPSETYTVLHVKASGDVKSIVQRRGSWVDQVAQLTPHLSGRVRLSIDPRQ